MVSTKNQESQLAAASIAWLVIVVFAILYRLFSTMYDNTGNLINDLPGKREVYFYSGDPWYEFQYWTEGLFVAGAIIIVSLILGFLEQWSSNANKTYTTEHLQNVKNTLIAGLAVIGLWILLVIARLRGGFPRPAAGGGGLVDHTLGEYVKSFPFETLLMLYFTALWVATISVFHPSLSVKPKTTILILYIISSISFFIALFIIPGLYMYSNPAERTGPNCLAFGGTIIFWLVAGLCFHLGYVTQWTKCDSHEKYIYMEEQIDAYRIS